MKTVRFILLVVGLLVPHDAAAQKADPPTLTDRELSGPTARFYLERGWVFRSGDHTSWAKVDLDEAAWSPSSNTRRFSDLGVEPWPGIGWFRLTLQVEPEVAALPLALHVHHVGASEIYVNGDMVQKFGTVSRHRDGEVVAHVTDMMAYSIALLPGRNVIAVRYSDHDTEALLRYGDQFGPHLALSYAVNAVLDPAQANRRAGVHLAAVTALPAIFALLHLLLFAFYPASRQNLYYAVFAASLAALDYNVFMHDFIHDRSRLMVFQRLLEVFIIAVSVSGARFVYSCFYDRLPRQFYLLLILAFPVLISGIQTRNLVSLYSLLCLVEMVRVMVLGVARRRPGARILAGGGLVFFMACSYELLGMLGLVPFLIQNIYIYGVLAMMASMSMYLAHQFAGISTGLRTANEKLTDYSHTLEERVDARTLELRQKNEELEQVLDELQGAQNQMVLQEKMASLGGLVAGIAHEINTPVGAINSIRDTLHRAHGRLREVLGEKADEGTARAAFEVTEQADEIIAGGTDRVAELVRSLRTFAQLDGAEYQNVDLHDGLDSAITLLQTQSESLPDVLKEYGEVPSVYCAGGKVNQVFLSILKNAAAAEAGEIRIRTSTSGGFVMVEIDDDGVGIPGEKLERIFDFGFRRSGSTVKMGFGLATSYNTVQEHGGDLSLQSEVGRGTQVTIRLPLGDGGSSA